MDANQNDILTEVANAVDWTVQQQTVETTEPTQQVVEQQTTVETSQPTPMANIQEDSKTLNEVAMEKELETEQSKRERELDEFVSKQMPTDVSKIQSTSPNTWDIVSEIPTLDKPLTQELEQKMAEARDMEKIKEMNKTLFNEYKKLANKYKDMVWFANDRINLANTLYKEEVEKNARTVSDPKRVMLDDKMYILNSIRNEYIADKSEQNKQKLAQNLVLMLSTLFPTIQPNEMVKYINNTQNRFNNIWDDRSTNKPVKTIPAPSFSIPRWLPKNQRGILG